MIDETLALIFVPAVDGNRDLDEADQWSVELVPMTASEQRKYMLAAVDGKSTSVKAKKASDVLAKIFGERVLKVRNLNDILNRPIETGADLYERSETDFIDEVWEALTKASTLRAGLKND